jgi:hypothetical protein
MPHGYFTMPYQMQVQLLSIIVREKQTSIKDRSSNGGAENITGWVVASSLLFT